MSPDAWVTAGAVVEAAFTVVLAIFAALVWRLNVRQHRLAHEARLQLVGAEAVFNPVSLQVRLELLLWNPSEAPAVIQDWEVLVRDPSTKFSQSLGAGKLVPTELFRVKTYVGGKGWTVQRSAPAAFALVETLLGSIGENSVVDTKLLYAGGRGGKVSSFEASVPVKVQR